MIVTAAPILPVRSDIADLRLQRILHNHRNQVRPCMYRCRWHVRNHLIALDRHVAPTSTQGTVRQLNITHNRVGPTVIADDDFNGVVQTAHIGVEIIDGHLQDTGV